jgi:U3 small nucleolar RNA-associated protein 21
MLASASNNGTVAVWDLEKRRLEALLKNVHDGPVTYMQFLQGEPLLLTIGVDNSIKVSPEATTTNTKQSF